MTDNLMNSRKFSVLTAVLQTK